MIMMMMMAMMMMVRYSVRRTRRDMMIKCKRELGVGPNCPRCATHSRLATELCVGRHKTPAYIDWKSVVLDDAQLDKHFPASGFDVPKESHTSFVHQIEFRTKKIG